MAVKSRQTLCLFMVCLLFGAPAQPFSSYAALGDSYASGNGAGIPTSLFCGRFSAAYPVQVAHQMSLSLRNLACAGSLMSTVLTTQVPWAGSSDVVSIEVGGNEADFFLLLNECVHQWGPLSTCDHAIVHALQQVEGAAFVQRFDHLIAAARRRLKRDSTLLVLGYARFFNDETDQCDHVSFSHTNRHHFLTKDKRKALNRILLIVNTVIQGAAEAHGARYVDIDRIFEGHRFCEADVVEPSPNGSWFFNDVKAKATSHHLRSRSTNQDPLVSPIGDFLNLTRTFHPNEAGHHAIANEIVRILHHS